MAFNAPRDGGFGIEVRDGRLPEVDGEVAIDAFTARTQEFEVGDTIELTAGRAVEEARLVGIVGFGDLDSLLGATVVLFTFDETLERFSPAGEFDQVEAMATEGIDEDALAEQVRDALDDDVEVLTSEELAEESAEALAGVLGVFTTALLAFAGVALFVGIFIIVNTFSITVAQRIREFALLRAVGASRRQVLASVLTEAGILGLLGGVVGVLLGVALAVGLQAMLAAFGMDLPAEGVVLLPRTVVVGVLVGFVVTMASAVAPALKATRVAPVEALQSAAIPPPARRGWLRPLLGALVAAGGVALLVAGLFGDVAVALLAGTVLVFLGIALLSPFLTRPILTVVGAPVSRLRGVPGELARENAMRSPRRTATTASALMIGVGLVGFVTVFGASMSASLSTRSMTSTGWTSTSAPPPSGRSRRTSATTSRNSRRSSSRSPSGWVSSSTRAPAASSSESRSTASPTSTPSRSPRARWRRWPTAASPWPSLSPRARTSATARRSSWPSRPPGEATLEVVAVFDDASIDVPAMISLDTHREHFVSDEVFAVGVVLEDGVSLEEGQAAVDEVLESYPGVSPRWTGPACARTSRVRSTRSWGSSTGCWRWR
jgi:putative ABC transport system permease protein